MNSSKENIEWENESGAYTNRGFAKEKLGDFEGAISDYDKAIENDSTMYEPYLNRGRSHYFLNNPKNACLDFKKAVSLGDTATRTWLNSAGGAWCRNLQMDKERNYDNDGLDPSEEYFRKKKKGNDEDTYFPPEESEPPHY